MAYSPPSGVVIGDYKEPNNITEAITGHAQMEVYLSGLIDQHRKRADILEKADQTIFRDVQEYDKYLKSLKHVEEINKKIADKKALTKWFFILIVIFSSISDFLC